MARNVLLTDIMFLEKTLENVRCNSYAEQRLIEAKRKYRSNLKKRAERWFCKDKDGNGYGEIINGHYDCDSGWYKILFANEHWSDEEKREFIDDNWVEINSPYDCTGKIFTYRISVCNTPKGVVAYIFEARDV